MSRAYWKTSWTPRRRDRLTRPGLAQVARQLAIIALALVVWAGLLTGFLSLTGRPAEKAAAVPPPASATPAPPTATPVPSPTQAALPTATEPVAAEPPATEPAGETVTPLPTETQAPPPTETPAPPPTETPAPAGVSYAADVQPILDSRCIQCHGVERVAAGLDLRSYAAAMAGSRNGPVVAPGDAAGSYLVEVIVSGEMPQRGPRLLPAQIQLIQDWINAGAPDN